MKYHLLYFAFLFTSYSQAAMFDLNKQMQCFDGSINSPLINISDMHANYRNLEINHKAIYKMNCDTNSTSLNCYFKYSLFKLTKNFNLDLHTVQLVTNLDDSPRNFTIKGFLGKKSILCVQNIN